MTREEWLAAAVVAGLRTHSNRDRAAHRSRGRDKDVLNDLQGAIGEIVALRELERRHGAGAVGHEMLHWDGGRGHGVQRSPDFQLDLGEGPVRLESKCHLDGARKVQFLINARAHERSKRRGAIGYLPLAGSLGRRLMRVGRLIELHAVDDWEIHRYQYGDPSRRRRLAVVSPDILGEPWHRLRPRLQRGPREAEERTLRGIAHGAIARFDELRDSGFDLTGLTHGALVARARAEASACWHAQPEPEPEPATA